MRRRDWPLGRDAIEVAILLFVLVVSLLGLSGCGSGGGRALSPLVDPPDSVRYVEANGRTRPYALVWPNGTFNLWDYGTGAAQCAGTSGPVTPYAWDVALVGQIPPVWLPTDTLRARLTGYSALDPYPVTAAEAWAVGGPDTLRGCLIVHLSGPCAARADTDWFALRRVP